MRTSHAPARFFLAVLLLAGAGSVAHAAATAPEASPPAPPQPTGPIGSEQRPLRVSSGTMAPLLLHRVDPQYTEEMKRRSGAVVMAAVIDPKGKVVKLTVISGPELLRPAYLAAMRQWTYKPYLLNGEPVFVQTTLTVIYDFGAP